MLTIGLKVQSVRIKGVIHIAAICFYMPLGCIVPSTIFRGIALPLAFLRSLTAIVPLCDIALSFSSQKYCDIKTIRFFNVTLYMHSLRSSVL